ncbi:aldo/keto reductase [Hymenobacter volaticus]|uniref:Aldo/keto reductase n=1 Tax=Hymenobacter volaticus TaxID=2932254 RepID=A0ABY4GBZ2_9BACT|nr:aldo/keto reductase [Hymenobacter volaticus]UOQ68272.1 aldo/keto reductase [Hymenobacter volaticus]
MKYNALGKTDLQVSEISFGCMSLGSDHAANHTLLHQALDQGITLFDTADLYQKGENEVTVGKAFKGRRQEVIIATKVGNAWRPDGSGWDWVPSKEYLRQAVEHSLRRLETDYIDLYQLHGGTLDDPIDDIIEAFELLKQQGKIRAYGISSIRPNVIREYVQRSHIASVMMQYSLLDRRPEESCLDLLQEQNIAVLARGSFAQGLLAGKAAKSYLNYAEQEVAQAAVAVQQVADISQRTAAEVAALFVLHHPAVTSAVLGVRTEQHLADALHIAATPSLMGAEVALLQQAIPPNVYEQHR